MITSIMYAHRSLYGADGYGFVGESAPVYADVKGEIHVLINRLGYDQRNLRGRAGVFWLKIGEDRRVLGRVSVKPSQGKNTLIYQFLLVSDWAGESKGVSPLSLLDIFEKDEYWQPDAEGQLAAVTADEGGALSSSRGDGRRSLALPPGFAAGIEKEIIGNWWNGLSSESQLNATFSIPEVGEPRSLLPFRGECHLMEGLRDKALGDQGGKPSPVKARFISVPMGGCSWKAFVQISAIIVLFIGFVSGLVALSLYCFHVTDNAAKSRASSSSSEVQEVRSTSNGEDENPGDINNNVQKGINTLVERLHDVTQAFEKFPNDGAEGAVQTRRHIVIQHVEGDLHHMKEALEKAAGGDLEPAKRLEHIVDAIHSLSEILASRGHGVDSPQDSTQRGPLQKLRDGAQGISRFWEKPADDSRDVPEVDTSD